MKLERKAWLPYFNALAARMRLAAWGFVIADEPPPSETAMASIICWYGRFGATIRLSEMFLDTTDEDQRYICVHELVHCYQAHADQLVDDELSADRKDAWSLAAEYGVDAAASNDRPVHALTLGDLVQLQRTNNAWTCLPASFATVLGLTLEDLLKRIGHDGSEVIWNYLPDPEKRRGFHPQEMIDVAETMGVSDHAHRGPADVQAPAHGPHTPKVPCPSLRGAPGHPPALGSLPRRQRRRTHRPEPDRPAPRGRLGRLPDPRPRVRGDLREPPVPARHLLEGPRDGTRPSEPTERTYVRRCIRR